MKTLKGPGIFLARFACDAAPFIDRHTIRVTEHAFDDFAAGGVDRDLSTRIMGFA